MDDWSVWMINPTMSMMDVAIVIGAGDIVNPAAREVKSSPIYGMPVVNVDAMSSSSKPSWHLVSPGSNPPFFKPNTRMRFGDAKVSLLNQPRRRSYCSVRERSQCPALPRGSRGSPTLGRPAGNVSRDDVVLLSNASADSWKRYLHCHSVTPEPD